MKYLISIEGQSIELPEEIAGDDDKLKNALAPYFPGAVNAKIMRAAEKDGVVAVTVIKQAGTKGLFPLAKLIEAPESQNPVTKLYQERSDRPLNQMSTEELLSLDDQVEQVLEEGSKQDRNIQTSLEMLKDAEPQPATEVTVGF